MLSGNDIKINEKEKFKKKKIIQQREVIFLSDNFIQFQNFMTTKSIRFFFHRREMIEKIKMKMKIRLKL